MLTPGGAEPVILHRAASGSAGPEFFELTLLPGRGMNLFQARALFPGLGEIDLLASPPLAEAAQKLNGGPADFMGVQSFSFGGAILLPFANRIRGKLTRDGRAILTRILGRETELPADWQGKHPGAQKCAMHGLILASKMEIVEKTQTSVNAVLHAGTFDGHWLSETQVDVRADLRPDSIHLAVTAVNAGNEDLPVGIGWHPYFALPGNDRKSARLRLPARARALVNNYDDEFPTGQIVPVSGTPYDFTAVGGAPLGSRYFDDTFLDLDKSPEGHTVFEIIAPAANYGVRITALSPEVTALQVYSPPDKNFVVIEPQFNLADPFSAVWPAGLDTGMAVLPPGAQVAWEVRWELFVAEET